MITLKFILLIIGSYFIGNILFAKIISQKQHDDITTHGSGNPGTMNMVRTHGSILGIVTLLLDAVKGAVPTIIAFYLFGGKDGGMLAINAMYVAGFFAVLGHVFPIIFKFKGGKGVATSFGMFMVCNPLMASIFFIIALLFFIIIKIGSLASFVFIISFVVYQTVVNASMQYVYVLAILYAILFLILYLHRENIKRLFKGKENKINFKAVFLKDKEYIQHLKNNSNKNIKN